MTDRLARLARWFGGLGGWRRALVAAALGGAAAASMAPIHAAPLFWACGVTALDAARAAAPDICIAHAPAHMLITDRPALGGGAGSGSGVQP